VVWAARHRNGVEQIRAALLCSAKAWISQADLGNAKAWMRDDSLRHRYEEMRNGMVWNGLEAHSKGTDE